MNLTADLALTLTSCCRGCKAFLSSKALLPLHITLALGAIY